MLYYPFYSMVPDLSFSVFPSSAEKMMNWRPRSRPRSHGESETRRRLRLQSVHTMRKKQARPSSDFAVRSTTERRAAVMRELSLFHRRAAHEPAETFASRLAASVSASPRQQSPARAREAPLPPPIPRRGPVSRSPRPDVRPGKQWGAGRGQAGSEARAARRRAPRQ